MTTLTERLRFLVSLNEPEHGGPYQGSAAQACVEAMAQAADEIERLTQRLDAIHLAYIEAANPGIDMEQVKRTRICGPACSEAHTYIKPCVLDGDAQILAAARASNREWARAQEQRLLDAMRSPDA